MIHNVYTIFDSAAAAFLPPIFLHRDEMAIRAIRDAAKNPQHEFARNPADYTLFCIGSWDDNTGTIELLPAMRNLGTALTIRGPVTQESVDLKRFNIPEESFAEELQNGKATTE